MNEIVEIMENEITDLRSFKKQQLIKINKYFGYIFKKRQTTRKKMIELLIPIHRKMVISKKIIEGKEECPICLNILNHMNNTITTCGHVFCRECIFKYITTEKEICPICRKPYIYEDLIKPFTPKDIDFLLLFIIQNNQNVQEENNEIEIIEQPQPIRYTYRINKYIMKLIYSIINWFLFYNSIIFLCNMILHPFTTFDYYQETNNYRDTEL